MAIEMQIEQEGMSGAFNASSDFSEDAITRLADDSSFDIADAVLEDVNVRLQDKTPTGRKSKVAKQAEAEKEAIESFQPVLLSTLAGINQIISKRWPEFEYREDEIRTLSVLGSKVLAKHMDLAAAKYADEIALAVYFSGTVIEKGAAYQMRIRQEKKARRVDPNATGTENE